MPLHPCTVLAAAVIAANLACDPCVPEDCTADQSAFMLRAEDGPLPSGVYRWFIELDDDATTAGECYVPELGTTIECNEGSAKAISKDLEIQGLKIDLTYEEDGETTRPDVIRVEVTLDEQPALSETYEIEYPIGNTCKGYCPDATVFGIIEAS